MLLAVLPIPFVVAFLWDCFLSASLPCGFPSKWCFLVAKLPRVPWSAQTPRGYGTVWQNLRTGGHWLLPYRKMTSFCFSPLVRARSVAVKDGSPCLFLPPRARLLCYQVRLKFIDFSWRNGKAALSFCAGKGSWDERRSYLDSVLQACVLVCVSNGKGYDCYRALDAAHASREKWN